MYVEIKKKQKVTFNSLLIPKSFEYTGLGDNFEHLETLNVEQKNVSEIGYGISRFLKDIISWAIISFIIAVKMVWSGRQTAFKLLFFSQNYSINKRRSKYICYQPGRILFLTRWRHCPTMPSNNRRAKNARGPTRRTCKKILGRQRVNVQSISPKFAWKLIYKVRQDYSDTIKQPCKRDKTEY